MNNMRLLKKITAENKTSLEVEVEKTIKETVVFDLEHLQERKTKLTAQLARIEESKTEKEAELAKINALIELNG